MFGYRVPAPDEAMLISGGKQKVENGGQFRIVTGHGAWVMPFFRKVRFLSLETHTVDFTETCYTNHGIKVNVSAVVAFKVDNSVGAITAAAQRFLNDQKKGQMEELTRKIFVGHLRGIVGRMTVEDIIQKREKLTEEVLLGSQNEMSAMGLHVDSMQIETFDDADGSYIVDMAKPQRAAIEQAAKIAQAQADQAAQEAQQISLRAQAAATRETQIAQAQYKADTDKASAEAEQAGPLAKAAKEQAVIEAQQQVAERQAILRERQLVAEVIKPAEAEKQRQRIEAEGEALAAEQDALRLAHQARGQAEQTKLLAEAQAAATKATAAAQAEQTRINGEATAYAQTQEAEAIRAQRMAEADGAQAMANANASNDGYLLRLKEIEMQPEIARALADGLGKALSTANITMFEGASDLQKLFSTVAQQGSALFSMFRNGLATPDAHEEEPHPQVPSSPASLVGGNNTPVKK